MIISNEVAKRYGDQGIVAISVNPGSYISIPVALDVLLTIRGESGNIATELYRTFSGIKEFIVVRTILG